MASTGPRWTVYVGKFPQQVDVDAVYDMMAKYRPVMAQYTAWSCHVELTFIDEASADMALQDLDGRKVFGVSLSASKSPSLATSSSAPMFNTQPIATNIPSTIYNPELGAQILHHASTRPDFLQAVLALMQHFGLGHNRILSRNPSSASTSSTLQSANQLHTGQRHKRPHSESPTASESVITDPSDTNHNGNAKRPKYSEISAAEESIEAEPEVAHVHLNQPLHVTLPSGSQHLCKAKNVVVVDVSTPSPSEKLASGDNNASLEIVPFCPQSSSQLPQVLALPRPDFVSDAQLESNRMTMEQIRSIPRFEGWEPGQASAKLFVKNLTHKASEADLRFIFGRFGHSTLFDDVHIRLMTKGKMHSQAFVSFPDVASAQLAQQSVNGYLLHDRPLILEFGKSPSGNALISEQSSTKDKIGP